MDYRKLNSFGVLKSGVILPQTALRLYGIIVIALRRSSLCIISKIFLGINTLVPKTTHQQSLKTHHPPKVLIFFIESQYNGNLSDF